MIGLAPMYPLQRSEAGREQSDAPGIDQASPFQFTLPRELEASGPPERRGLRRDAVRLMVLDRSTGGVTHTSFTQIGRFLRPGDLLVANDSRTIPALLHAVDEHGAQVEVRLARKHADNAWESLLLPHWLDHTGELLKFAPGLTARVVAQDTDAYWLWTLQFSAGGAELTDRLYRTGEPVRYTYVSEQLPIDDYQTVYAGPPGSVEMPSAGRPFSWELLQDLRRRGVDLAFLTLHTGLSSVRDDALDALRLGHDEHFSLPRPTAEAVNRARARGGRVIAIGTTVVRTLETVAAADGSLHAAAGTTSLYISGSHRLCAVDGLLTGLHEPAASHLDLLSAFAPPAILWPAYEQALDRGYLWHEFGDVNLII